MTKSKFNYRQLTTKLGLPIYFMNLPHAPTVGVGVLVKAGTREETWPAEAGLAHALEHMVFQGTKRFSTSREVSAYIEDVGGIVNAWTTKEMTFFWRQVPTAYAERAFISLADQLRDPLILEERIPTEMQNIVQEIKRRNDDQPQYLSHCAEKFLYGDHPLGKDILGLEDIVLNLHREHFLNFWQKLYHPGNCVLIIAGQITEVKIVELATNLFSEPQSSPTKRQSIKIKTSLTNELTIKREIEQVHLLLAQITPAVGTPEARHLSLFQTMISGGMSFPLFQEVRDKRGLCYSVYATMEAWSDGGDFSIYVGTDPVRYREAITTVHQVIIQSKTDTKLLERAKQVILGRLALSFESTAQIISTAAQDVALLGKPRGYDEIEQEIITITISDIKNTVETYLQPEKMKTIMLLPK